MVAVSKGQGGLRVSSTDRSKFSTRPLETLWWRADISKEDVRWVRQHLGHGLDGLREFEAAPKVLYSVNGPLGRDWSSRVHFVRGEMAPHVQIAIGEKYDYRGEYMRAREKRDPHLSPHGFFLRLENGYHEHAMQFMQQFGPLTWMIGTGRQGEEGWVNLSDFWNRHTRFVGVVKLWDARFEDERLKEAWRWVHERLDRINQVPPAPFGHSLNWNLDKWHGFPGVFPWKREGGIEEGLKYPSLYITTVEIVHYELNLNTQDCRQVWMMQSVLGNQDVRFQPTRSYRSLWGAIWDLFGQDISNLTHGWRVCHECGKRFYPKDHRSVCCTSKHQALWSKRKWAREHRRAQTLSTPKS